MNKISASFITSLFPCNIQTSRSSEIIVDSKNLIFGELATLAKTDYSRRNFSNSYINSQPKKSLFKDSYVTKSQIDNSAPDSITTNAYISISAEVIFCSKDYSAKLTEALDLCAKAAGNLYQYGCTNSAREIPYTVQKLSKIYSKTLELQNELRKLEDQHAFPSENALSIQETQHKITFYIDMLKERIIPGFKEEPEFLQMEEFL